MKKLLLSFTCGFLVLATPAYSGGVIKEVCKDKLNKDGKAILNADGSTQKTCKKIKVHQKVEGEKIPNK